MTSNDSQPADSEPGEAALWQRYARRPELELRNQLIEHHLPLARTVAAVMFARRGGLSLEFGDYLQLATLGLIDAIDRYDPAQGATFSTFASPRIRGSILNNLEALSEHYQQLGLRKRLRQERLESLGQSDTTTARRRDSFDALADVAVGLTLSRMLEGTGMLAPAEPGATPFRQEFYDTARETQLRESLQRLVEGLPQQERRVLRYHYYQNLGFSEIADLLGLSRGRISQIHRLALQLLKKAQQGGAPLDLGV